MFYIKNYLRIGKPSLTRSAIETTIHKHRSQMMNSNTALTLTACVILLGACTAPAERPLMSTSSKGPAFEAARQECIKVSEGYRTGTEKQDIAIGAVVGAAVVAAEEDTKASDAAIGALIGGALGAADTADRRQREQRNVVIRCMQNRGFDVVG